LPCPVSLDRKKGKPRIAETRTKPTRLDTCFIASVLSQSKLTSETMIMNTAIEYTPEIKQPVVGLGFSHLLAEQVLSRTKIPLPAFKKRSLDKEGDKSSILFKEEQVMAFQRSFSPSKSMAYCGLSVIPNQKPTLKAFKNSQGNYFTGFGGLNSCDNYLCPCCNQRVAAERRRLTQNSLLYAQKNGYSVNLLTFTINKIGTARERIQALNSAYNYIISNSLRKYARRRGVKDFQHTRSIDLTINEKHRGKEGHFHIHAIVLMDKEVSGIKEYIWNAYKTIMKRLGYAPSKDAYDYRPVKTTRGIQDYLNKSFYSLSFETTSGMKDGRVKDSMGVLNWLYKVSENPKRRQIELYKALIKETRRVRWWSCSRGFKEMGESYKNKKDEEIKEVFSQEIGHNLWYAINSLSGSRAMIQHLLMKRLENPDGDHDEWKQIHVLIAGSLYEPDISPRLIETYQLELKRILQL
jgi:hypothetical protein